MSFQCGAIIKRDLEGVAGFVYSHMGIFVDEDHVIHFAGKESTLTKTGLGCDTLKAFAAGHYVSLHLNPGSQQHGINVAYRAMEAQAHCEVFSDDEPCHYSAAWNNCEDFCLYCYQAADEQEQAHSFDAPISQRGATTITGLSVIGVVAALAYLALGWKK